MVNTISEEQLWVRSSTEDFWQNIARDEHVVQIYDTSDELMDTVVGFAGTGINSGESVVIIATRPHLQALKECLESHAVQVKSLEADNRLILVDAQIMLSRFIIDNLPDPIKFRDALAELVSKARGSFNRPVRIFGEMVSILWSQGLQGATLKLESLWEEFCAHEHVRLYCAYPSTVFTGELHDDILHVCNRHAKMIRSTQKPFTEILYKVLERRDGTEKTIQNKRS